MTLYISEVNLLDSKQFVSIFGNVIELCPEAALKVQNNAPFKNVKDLVEAFHSYLEELNENEKLTVLKVHPDLAGRLATRGELTRESAGEQRSAGLNDISDEQRNTINLSNEKYKKKFDFPFIICARENKVQSIIEGLERRYNNRREEEITTGINEVKKICKLRILDIVRET